jgi:SAM-dependent methyltransferase
MSSTYSNVDGSRDVAAALDWQDRIDAWPAIRAYKQRTYELIGAARPILDVGSGTGFDASSLNAVGVDRSRAMCERARTRDVSCTLGDAARLPIRTAGMAAVRCDRVLQHVADPDAAIAEFARVTQPGGRIVVADPDQDTLVLSVPGAPDALVAELRRRRRDDGFVNGSLAHALPERFVAHGLRDVTVDAFPLVLTNPDDAFGLPTWPTFWGIDAPAWDDAMARARTEPGFVYALLYFVVSGAR